MKTVSVFLLSVFLGMVIECNSLRAQTKGPKDSR